MFNMPTIEDFENPAQLDEFMPNVLTMVIAYAVKDLSSHELDEAMQLLYPSEDDDDTFNGNFCDRYDLGETIYEALDLYDLDVQDVLSELLSARKKAEDEANRD